MFSNYFNTLRTTDIQSELIIRKPENPLDFLLEHPDDRIGFASAYIVPTSGSRSWFRFSLQLCFRRKRSFLFINLWTPQRSDCYMYYSNFSLFFVHYPQIAKNG